MFFPVWVKITEFFTAISASAHIVVVDSHEVHDAGRSMGENSVKQVLDSLLDDWLVGV